MRSGCVDDLEGSDHKMEVVIDEVESRWRLNPALVNFGRKSSGGT